MSKPYIIVRFTTIFSQKLSSSPLLCTVPCWPQVFKLISFHSFCSLTITPASVFFAYMYMLLLTRSSFLKNMPPPLQILICQHQTLTADHSVVCLIITTATKKGLRANFSPHLESIFHTSPHMYHPHIFLNLYCYIQSPFFPSFCFGFWKVMCLDTHKSTWLFLSSLQEMFHRLQKATRALGTVWLEPRTLQP